MPVKESSATALVRFTGFAFIYFDSESGMGKIAAIRDTKHSLTFRVREPFYQDGAGKDLVAYQDVLTYENLPKEGVEIEIRALSGPAIEGYEIYRSGDFDRLTSGDAHDFGWVVNLDALNDEGSLRPTGHRPHPVTKISVGNGFFYTYKVDPRLTFEKVEIDPGGAETGREVFGNVAETIGVKIEAAEVGLTIRIGGVEETHTFRRVEGLPRLFEFKNMDHNPNAVYSDMADYYGFLSSPTGKRFSLEPIIEDADGEGARGGSVNQQQFCHPVATDLPPID